MAYTIIRSDGTILTTIQDGTINTTSSSLGLPGRNKAGYGQTIDTNMVRLLENFANQDPPAHPLKGQLWYDTSSSPAVLRVCPADNTTVAADWPALASTSTTGNTVVPNLLADELISGNNLSITNDIDANTITVALATATHVVSSLANVTTANIGTTRTTTITTGGATTDGSLTGRWAVTGNITVGSTYVLTALGAASSAYGIKCDNYMYANGSPYTPSGTYTNANVEAYLTDSTNGFDGDIYPNTVTTGNLIASGSGSGAIDGTWTLTTGSTIEATYADLAERYESDVAYEVGTVVELGGEKEVTIASELSEQVFGVVSNTYAYLMNEAAGSDATHPAIAIAGRVKVKVVGKINKHERLVSAGNGYARAAASGELTPFNSIGRALEAKSTEDAGVIEAVVIVK